MTQGGFFAVRERPAAAEVGVAAGEPEFFYVLGCGFVFVVVVNGDVGRENGGGCGVDGGAVHF